VALAVFNHGSVEYIHFLWTGISVCLFALLGAENAHIRKSRRKMAFGSAQNATF